VFHVNKGIHLYTDIPNDSVNKIYLKIITKRLAWYIPVVYLYIMINETTTRKSVQAQYLKKGDVLASGGVVTSAPSSGLNTPSGKIDLGINGFRRTWNKRTEITIISHENK